MCIAVPMQVRRIAGHSAVCVAYGDSGEQLVSTLLLDEQPVAGAWLLVHLGSALRETTAEEAEMIAGALAALGEALAGNPFEHLIADLVEREPELPEHLRAAAPAMEHADGD